ncbi:thymidine kinase, partial [Ralstonia pseudosolanacearum]
MNCGKTTSLLQVAYNYKERGMNVLVLKPSIDKKGGKSVVSRLGSSREVDYLVTPDESIIDLVHDDVNEKKQKLSCILVDEAQFLQP